jgi:hypothetical protein
MFLIIAFLFIASKSTLSDAVSVRSVSPIILYAPLPQSAEGSYSVSHTPHLVYMGVWNYNPRAERAENITLAAADLTASPVYTDVSLTGYPVQYSTSRHTVTYRELSESSEPVYLTDLSKPQITGNPTIGVAPFGYIKHDNSKLVQQVPIRDFRADYWETKYYRDKFYNAASYNETYKFNNIYNQSEYDSGD